MGNSSGKGSNHGSDLHFLSECAPDGHPLSSYPVLTLDQTEVFRSFYSQGDAFLASLIIMHIEVLIHSFSVAFLNNSLAHERNVSRSFCYSATSWKIVRLMFSS